MKQFILIFTLFCFLITHGQEKFVEIDGQRFHIKHFRTNEITVIFENGMSDSLEVWGFIPDSVAKFASVFLYDRADIGKSDTSRIERTIPNVVSELRWILEKEDIKPPYVLVGHSLGGCITRYFVSKYPQEIKSLLLLDPSPEKFWNRMTDKELKEYIKGGNEWYHTKFKKRYWKEWYQFIPNLKYMENLNIPKELPVILVSASAWNWYKYQKEIIAGLKNAKHIELEGQHHIYKDHPQLIIEYIKTLTIK
jgi:pimeloyl-ACP methyl ester carboxylesterase